MCDPGLAVAPLQTNSTRTACFIKCSKQKPKDKVFYHLGCIGSKPSKTLERKTYAVHATPALALASPQAVTGPECLALEICDPTGLEWPSTTFFTT